MNNQLNMWYTGQLVTSDQMNNFAEDLYFRIGFLTDATVGTEGSIINLTTVTQSGTNVTLGAGSFRFPNTSLGYLLYTPPLIGNAPAATVAVAGNGFVVAQYTVIPTPPGPVAPGEYEYVFVCNYAFVTALAANMVKIATITGGLITEEWGQFSSTPSINDIVPSGNLILQPSKSIALNIPDINDGSSISLNLGQRPTLSYNGGVPVSNNVFQIIILNDIYSNINGLTQDSAYQKFPAGQTLNQQILQCGYGEILTGTTSITLNFETAFPNKIIAISPSINDSVPLFKISYTYTLTSVTIHVDTAPVTNLTVSYIAIGY